MDAPTDLAPGSVSGDAPHLTPEPAPKPAPKPGPGAAPKPAPGMAPNQAPSTARAAVPDQCLDPAPRTVAATPLQPTARTSLRRSKERAATDREALDEVLLDGMFCHLGVVVDGVPLVLPTAYGVDLDRGPDGTLYLHGSVAARSMQAAGQQTVCVTITHADGLVLARSAFHHSVNYRSAVIFGTPRPVTDPAEKLHGLNAIVDHLVPGRSRASRPPNRKELAATSVLALALTEASVKSRSGGASDDEADLDLPYWTGVIPLRLTADEPITNDDCELMVPGNVRTRANILGAAGS